MNRYQTCPYLKLHPFFIYYLALSSLPSALSSLPSALRSLPSALRSLPHAPCYKIDWTYKNKQKLYLN